MSRFWIVFIFILWQYQLSAQINLPIPNRSDDALMITPIDNHTLAYLDGEGIGMMSLSGTRLSKPIFFSIYPLGEGMYAAQQEEGGLYALVHGQGRLMTPFEYHSIGLFSSSTARVERINRATSLREYAVLSHEGLLLSSWMDMLSEQADDGWYTFRNEDKYGVWQADTSYYFSQKFQEVKTFHAGLAAARQDDKFGYIDLDGNWVIAPQYQKATTFEGKYATVQLAENQWQIINRQGDVLLEQAKESIEIYAGGAYSIVTQQNSKAYLNHVLQPLNRSSYQVAHPFGQDGIARVERGERSFYLDLLGNEIFEADSLQEFLHGVGVFQKDEKWGWVNEDGEVLVDATYDEVQSLNSRYALVNKDKQTLLISHQGKVIQTWDDEQSDFLLTEEALFSSMKPNFFLIDILRQDYKKLDYDEVGSISDGAIVVKKDNRFGYINLQAEELIPVEYEAVSLATNGLLLARKSSTDGFIAYNDQGQIQFQLDRNLYFLGPFQSDRAKVMDASGRMGFIDSSGELVVPCKYAVVGDYHHDRAIFRDAQSGLFGYLNLQGEEVIPAIYKFTSDFDESGYAAVIKDQHFGFINDQGKVAVPFQYSQVMSLKNGIASVWKDEKFGYINMQNKTVVPFTFDEAYQAVQDLALVRVDKYWGYINARGKVKIPWQFSEAQPFSEDRAWVQLNNLYGLIDTKGTYLTAFTYEDARPFQNGYAVVEKEGKLGLISKQGAWTIPAVCDEISAVEDYKCVVSISATGYAIDILK